MSGKLLSTRLLGVLCLLATLLGPAAGEVRRYRVQLEVQRQGEEKLDQRSYWVQEQVPRPLELDGLPVATRICLSVVRDLRNQSLVVFFQVDAPPTAQYQELTSPRLIFQEGSPPQAFCFAMQGQVYRISLTSLKVQVLQ